MSEGSAVFAMLLGMGLVWGDDMRAINALKGRVVATESRAAAFLSEHKNVPASSLQRSPEAIAFSSDGHSPVSNQSDQLSYNSASEAREPALVHGNT